MVHRRRLELLVLALFIVPLRARAETDSRDYEALVALPNRSVAAVVYYRHVSANDKGSSYSQDVGALRAAYILRFKNISVVPVDVLLPIADVTAYLPIPMTPASAALRASGIGDFLFFPTVGYLLPEGAINHTYFAFTPYFSFPTGQYDKTHLLNIGTNRYGFTQEFAIGQRFLKIADVELVGAVSEYTANDNFLTPAGMPGSLKQDPGGMFTVHASVDVAPTVYLAMSYYVTVNGAEHFTNSALNIDVKTADTQTVHTLRFGAAIRVEKQTLALLQYNQDVAANNGALISRFIGARISHVW
jgi:hypothetical protein